VFTSSSGRIVDAFSFELLSPEKRTMTQLGVVPPTTNCTVASGISTKVVDVVLLNGMSVDVTTLVWLGLQLMVHDVASAGAA
jgi:hypothetical protein